MSKKIEFKYQDTDYCLEYNRESIKIMESKGFNYDEFTRQPLNMGDLAFQGALYKNHRRITGAKANEIFESLADKAGLINALLEMIQEAYEDTYSSDSEGKNVEWKIS